MVGREREGGGGEGDDDNKERPFGQFKILFSLFSSYLILSYFLQLQNKNKTKTPH